MVEPDTIDPLPSPVPDDGQDPPKPQIPTTLADPMTAAHSQVAPYQENTFDIEYTEDTGLMMLPTGKESGANIVVKRASKAGGMIVHWRVSRWFEKPLLPSRETNDPNNVFLRMSFMPANPLQTRNGLLWVCSGRYEYGFKVPKDVEDPNVKFATGAPSAEVATPDTRFYGAADFDKKPLDMSALKSGGGSLVLNQVIQSNP